MKKNKYTNKSDNKYLINYKRLYYNKLRIFNKIFQENGILKLKIHDPKK